MLFPLSLTECMAPLFFLVRTLPSGGGVNVCLVFLNSIISPYIDAPNIHIPKHIHILSKGNTVHIPPHQKTPNNSNRNINKLSLPSSLLNPTHQRLHPLRDLRLLARPPLCVPRLQRDPERHKLRYETRDTDFADFGHGAGTPPPFPVARVVFFVYASSSSSSQTSTALGGGDGAGAFFGGGGGAADAEAGEVGLAEEEVEEGG